MSTRSAEVADVEVIVRGELPKAAAERARRKVARLLERLGDPVLHTRIRLTHQADPAVAHPVHAQANLDLGGRVVRVQVAASTGNEAVDLLVERLRGRMTRLKQHWQVRRGGVPAASPHEWRHGDVPTHRPPYYPRPIEQRQIIRHKSFSATRTTPDEAAWEMYRMDYDFHVFTEATGRDAVIYRGGSTGLRLARLESGPKWLNLSAVPITLSPHTAPRLTVAEAKQRLDITVAPFVFFEHAQTGRGNVLYRRYDGHYGLITPVR
jgi:hypothetical protein